MGKQASFQGLYRCFERRDEAGGRVAAELLELGLDRREAP